MNRPIRTVSIFCMFLFLALMVNVTYLQFWHAEELNTDPANARVAEAAFSRERGVIIAGEGRDQATLARSTEIDDQYKYLRVYPQPLKYANVTGYLTLGTQTGIERSQNTVLSGEDPRLFVTRLIDLAQNQSNKGGNVLLTLDPQVQEAAYDALLSTVGPDGEGSVVAIEPKTGRVLAMVSLPSYDPNDLATHDFAASREAYNRLDSDEQEPLVNRAIQTRLFPGSTFKVVTASAAIENGLYTADDDVPAGATWQTPGTTGSSNVIDNEGRFLCNPEQVSFATAMAQSCNTAFAKMAVELGPEAMREQAEAFGFNSEYLLDLSPQVESVYPTGVEGPDGETVELNDAQTAQTGFGQFEVQATPLQMAMVVSALANRGTLMRPYLVEEVQDADYSTLEQTEPDELRDAVSPSTADQVTDLMLETVNNGTAFPAQIPGVSVAGKTGTAQRGVEGQPPYGWFVSFAPAEDAEVAVAVMIQEAPGKEIAGGQLGGPIAKAVMEAVLDD
ncbi:peptidoglycan D,D-transpeptidase FtsI family protein [Nocardioides bizhenqiangii]|uniref:Penicillin-binding protein 2 n=1 Tax=Nocardioides bizhenqiangii TaxID=3095076 RepID=A0ABZ0ZSM7_9ACTN|nr:MULTISPECIES: penicillin-binding protein 2 [unclassified Nocardioides]MDZ5619320.1 penicillin-binding protein 2 [Nocardioides sp. HM23]WQQ26657.1 penicillin-binding protein 2 [Nocardioides sp. HM61]